MSEMIGRVARAIADRDTGGLLWQDYIPDAKAAIRAMQVPTHEMMEAGANACAKTVSRMKSANVCYRAMIDEALRDV